MSFTFSRSRRVLKVERFPYTLPALAIISFGALTSAFISLGTDVNPALAQKANTISEIFIIGIVMSILTSIIFYRGKALNAIAPRFQWEFLTSRQAGVTVIGLVVLGLFQYTLNQASLVQFLLAVGPTTALIFKIDAAIAEEVFFSAWIATMIYTAARYRSHPIAAAAIAMLMTALTFLYYHIFVYSTNPNALFFRLWRKTHNMRSILIHTFTNSCINNTYNMECVKLNKVEK